MKVTINSINGSYASTDALNANFTALATAIENTLSRDGTSPNYMSVDLDMNGYRIINQLAQSGDGFIWYGPWATATSYALNSLVSENGSTYICTEAHTSDAVFANDLALGKWELLADKGANGAGSGDLLAVNNLSDVADATVARANLGLVIDGTVQSYDAATAKTDVANVFTTDQTLGVGASLVFEGSTDDGFETTLSGGDPTADRTITLPDATTTLPGLDVAQTFTKGQRGEVTSLTSSAASIAIDLADSNNFSHTTTENTTLASPSNPVAGQSGVITITQGATPRTLAYNSFWKFPSGAVPALTASAGAVDVFTYYVNSASFATCQLIKGVA
jgi:hypothetical protein